MLKKIFGNNSPEIEPEESENIFTPDEIAEVVANYSRFSDDIAKEYFVDIGGSLKSQHYSRKITHMNSDASLVITRKAIAPNKWRYTLEPDMDFTSSMLSDIFWHSLKTFRAYQATNETNTMRTRRVISDALDQLQDKLSESE